MSLADALAAAKLPMRGMPCPIAVIIEQLEDRDRIQLLDAMDLPTGTPGRLPTTVITKALISSGWPVHYKGVDRHRNGMCRCFSGSS